eukprot:TRINITY_DN349_c0_g1_i2.p1 TRINITY_DN349_c0_g1~~TRINITY_DN349_c0_g1_i2.p1  ORF type:complete len:512 (-),score=130.84 TRINITY_DN349_c0_g1_i2:24-1559(-)
MKLIKKNLKYRSSLLGHFKVFNHTSKYKYCNFSSINNDTKDSTFGINNDKEYDILIVGGGMIGPTLAQSLLSTPLSSHLKIGIIESNKLEMPDSLKKNNTEQDNTNQNSENIDSEKSNHPELRVSTLSPSTVRLLESIGVWDDIQSTGRVAPFYSMKVWDSIGMGSIEFNASDLNLTSLGFVVENKLVTSSLFSKLQQNKTNPVDFYMPVRVENVEKGDIFNTLTTSDGSTLKAKLVVGSDGFNSVVRRKSDISHVGWSYNQKGVVATVKVDSLNTTAWQRFLPDGDVIALLPLFDDYSSIVWSTSNKNADKLLGLNDEDFSYELQRAFHASENRASSFPFNVFPNFLNSVSKNSLFQKIYAPNVLSVVGKRGAFPLKLSQSLNYVHNRIALIGDAAHSTHPLAGQGANLGFNDVICLTNVILDALETGHDIGSPLILKNYEKQMFNQNCLMLGGIDTLQKVFSVNFLPFGFARNLGLTITDNVGLLKHKLADFAVGTQMNVSRIGKNVQI